MRFVIRAGAQKIIGVHTPEFGYENDVDNAQEAVRQANIRYPVVPGNRYATWKRLRSALLAGVVPERSRRLRPLQALRQEQLLRDRSENPTTTSGEGSHRKLTHRVQVSSWQAEPGLEQPAGVFGALGDEHEACNGCRYGLLSSGLDGNPRLAGAEGTVDRVRSE